MTLLPFPDLETNRLQLRELHDSDLDQFFKIFSDPLVTEFYNIKTFVKRKQAEELLERRLDRFYNDKGICWAIVPKSVGHIVGTCGFNAWFKQRQVGDLGYELARPFWNQGLMTEALEAVVKFGFEEIGLIQQRAWVIPENQASARVLLKLGFESKGVQLARGYWDNTFHDLELFTATVPNPPDIEFPI